MQPSGSEPTPPNIHTALQLHQSGALSQAEAIYRALLSNHPDEPNVLHFLGLLCHQTNRPDEALTLLQRSISLDRSNPRYAFNVASVLKTMGHIDEACDLYRRAIALRPDYAEAHDHLGHCMALNQQWAAAAASYRVAITHRPQWAEAHHRLGIVLSKAGDGSGAMASYRRALEINPNFAEAWNDLGARFSAEGNTFAAIEAYRRAVDAKKDHRDAYNNLAAALRDVACPREAIEVLQRALPLDPTDPLTHFNLANSLRDLGDLDASAQAASESLRIQPDWEDARYGLAVTRLLQGDFLRGWPDCEARWQSRVPRAEYPIASHWDGSDPAGQRILLHADHGFGDTIQFVRYAPLLVARGARVSIRCQPDLIKLLSNMNGIDQIVGNDKPAPEFDIHCPLIALPRIFDTTLQSIPAQIPYLTADPQLAQKWQARLSKQPTGLKIGIAWAGSPAFREDRFRSPHLNAFAPLAGIVGVQFYSLQKGPAAQEILSAPPGLKVIDWTDEIRDFADTAALIDWLDLVLSSDTAVVHVAGALGKPVWTLLHYAPGFFWMLNRPDSPWYPTMRLFRQQEPGNWEPVFQQAAVEIRSLVTAANH